MEKELQSRIDAFYERNPSSEEQKNQFKSFEQDWLTMDDSELWDKYGGNSKLNRPITQSYLVNAAIRMIQDNIIQASYRIYRGNKEVIRTDPVYKLFHYPNERMSINDLWQNISGFMFLYGECFILMNKGVGQKAGITQLPAEFEILDPRYVDHRLKSNGRLDHWVYMGRKKYQKDEVIHMKMWNPYNQIRGLAPVDSIGDELMADYKAGQFNANRFDNDAVPRGIIELDAEVDINPQEMNRLYRSWNQRHSGTGNSGKIGVIQGGSFKPIGLNSQELDFINSREFTKKSVLSAFRVNSFILGLGDTDVNRSTAQVQKRLLWTVCLHPHLLKIEDNIQRQFFDKFAPEYWGQFDTTRIPEINEILEDTMKIAKEMQSLGYSSNEINMRLNLGMPLVDELDVRRIPMNLIEIGTNPNEMIDDEPEPEQEPEPEDNSTSEDEPEKPKKTKDDSIEKLKEAVKERHLKNFLRFQSQSEKLIQTKIKRFISEQRNKFLTMFKMKKDLNQEQLDMMSNLYGFFESQKEKLTDMLRPIYFEVMKTGGQLALANIGVQRSINNGVVKQDDDVLQDYILQFVVNENILEARLNKVSGISDTIYDQIKKSLFDGIKEGDSIKQLADRVKDVYRMATNRSLTIARTESVSLMNGTSHSVYQEEGVSSKEWLSAEDSKTRESHASVNGTIVGINDTFNVGGYPMKYPGDPAAPISETANCRCSISPVIPID
jgi:HK97 family phage portal protein